MNISEPKNYGNYININGKKINLKKHPTDFSVIGRTKEIESELCREHQNLSENILRITAQKEGDRDPLMLNVRNNSVAHHIYQIENTQEELIIDNRIIVALRYEGTGELEQIIKKFHLVAEGRLGSAHVLKVTDASGRNPLKIANEISEREGVLECSPEILNKLELYQQPALFSQQWYLTDDLINHPDLSSGSDTQVPEAWTITKGHPDIVIAVIDDGFDLGHPALQNIELHPETFDFVDSDSNPNPQDSDYHGTPVASIAVGSHSNNSAMKGIAPLCTFLPVRMPFGGEQFARPYDIASVFQHVSQYADIVNCSFGTSPSSFDSLPMRELRNELSQIAKTGGRRGKGLVMVFAAGNDDAPTYLESNKNLNGVKFTRTIGGLVSVIEKIPANEQIFSLYPMIEGVIVVGAMSSLKRKSGYSNWGPHITIVAPSNNGHYIQDSFFAQPDPIRDEFTANYRGLGQVAASNRPGQGNSFSPIRRQDDITTPNLQENLYTKSFGGTSGAAPIVSGIAGLMLSVNPDLTASQIRNILMKTADTNLDTQLDLANDPNIQGLSGDFINDRSRFFGSGKVNAFKAVSNARALFSVQPLPSPPDDITPTPVGREYQVNIRENRSIPDNRPMGITSSTNMSANGVLKYISVRIDITHSARGNLKVKLIAPNGEIAVLHRPSASRNNDIKQTFSSDNNAELGQLVQDQINIQGQWHLNIVDNARRELGVLNSWSLTLETV